MTIAAKISATELTLQARDAYAEKYFEVALLNAPGVGYLRQVIYYNSADVRAYADDGVALSPKAAIFSHNGNNSTPLTFTHVAFLRGAGNVKTLAAVTNEPDTGTVDGVYYDVPVENSGDGKGMEVTLTISGSVSTVAISRPGYGYVAGQVCTIDPQTLSLIGANDNLSNADAVAFSVGTVSASENTIVSVARPDSDVTLLDGNQAIFYFNLKQFGYYNKSN